MSFNFPNSPTPGQLYTPVGGYRYVYLDGVWRVVEAPQDVGTAETRNRIVNGAMQISQENGNTLWGPAATHDYHVADQWRVTGSTSTGTTSLQRIQSVTPNGSKDRARITVGTAKAVLAAGDYFQIFQSIEGGRIADFRYGSASARQVVLRFGFKAPAGTYSIEITNSVANRHYVANFTIAAGQANTDTEHVFIVPGDTTGAWLTDTGAGFVFRVIVAAGSSFLGVAGWQATYALATSFNTNGMATAGNVFELYDVGLYLDPLATGIAPPWTMPDEAEELRACQRYWQKNVTAFFSGNVTSGSTYYGTGKYTVPMRIVPALTGATLTQTGFAAGAGSFGDILDGYYETRAANATVNGGLFRSTCWANARM